MLGICGGENPKLEFNIEVGSRGARWRGDLDHSLSLHGDVELRREKIDHVMASLWSIARTGQFFVPAQRSDRGNSEKPGIASRKGCDSVWIPPLTSMLSNTGPSSGIVREPFPALSLEKRQFLPFDYGKPVSEEVRPLPGQFGIRSSRKRAMVFEAPRRRQDERLARQAFHRAPSLAMAPETMSWMR